MTGMVWTITGDDALDAGRDPAQYAAEVRRVLAPFNVAVDFQPGMRGAGGLRGAVDSMREVDIKQAVARLRTAGAETLAELNDDAGYLPRSEETATMARRQRDDRFS